MIVVHPSYFQEVIEAKEGGRNGIETGVATIIGIGLDGVFKASVVSSSEKVIRRAV